MKCVLLSIRPKWCEKIVNGEKTIEGRKSRPKIETPFKCYIYCTKPSKKCQTICGCMVINTDELYRLPNGEIKHDWSGELMRYDGEYTKNNFLNGKVIGEFICDKVYSIKNQGNTFVVANEEHGVTNEIARQSCLDYDDMVGYLGNKDGYGWHITDLKVYGNPKELIDFIRPCSYAGLCFSCDRAKFTSKGDRICQAMISRPPQSYMFVEEVRNDN